MLRTLLQFECSSLPVDCLAPFLSVMNSQRFSPRWPHDGVLRPVAGNTGLQGQTIPFFVEGDAAPGEQGPPPYHSLVVHPDDSPLPDMLPYDEEDAACKGLNVADVFVGEEKPAAQFLMRLQSSRDVWDTVRQYYVADDPRATKELFWCAYRLGHKVGVPESTMRLLAWALVVVDQNNGYPPRERSFFQPCVQPGTLFVPTDIESICTQCVDGSINPITCCMRCGRALKKESPDNLGPECRRKRKHAETE
jgi:hypothetical protein